MQDLPQMPPLQPIFAAAQPTPYEQMLMTLMEAEAMLYKASAMAEKLSFGLRFEIADRIDAGAEKAGDALSFARNPPEDAQDDDPRHSQNEEWYMEQARERGLL